jgi:hypothetical protein
MADDGKAARKTELDRLVAAPYPLGKRERQRMRRLMNAERARDMADDTAELDRAIDKMGASALKVADEYNALLRAVLPIVVSYEVAADPIGDSDLYDEQPRSVSVTLGDLRTLARLFHSFTAER